MRNVPHLFLMKNAILQQCFFLKEVAFFFSISCEVLCDRYLFRKLLVLYCMIVFATVIRVHLFSWMVLFVPGSNCTILGLCELIN